MPDTSFSWRGLREHLRQYIWIYLAGIALCLFGTNLLFTVTRPHYANDQVVAVYLADYYSDPELLSGLTPDMLAAARAVDERVEEVRFESLMFNDQEYTSSMLLATRLAIGECDAFLASQSAIDALTSSEALVPLDDLVAGGWLAEYGLEPYTVAVTDEQTGATRAWVAALRLDPVDALASLGAFNNEGAYLCLAVNGKNVEATQAAVERMIEQLMEDNDAGTEAG